MRQNIPVSQGGLLGRMNVAIEAADSHSATVGLVHNTAVTMSFARAAAVLARDARELGKEELRKLRELLETERIATREFALLGRDQLKPALGRLYHPGWDVTGFRGGFRVSERASDLEVWAETFHGYLVRNPDKEVPAHNITAAQAAERYEAIKNARAAVKAQEGALTTLVQKSDAAFALLLKMLRGLVKELSLILAPDDGRWTAFGFNAPATKERPETPTNVTAVSVAENVRAVQWDKAPRAESYRVRIKVVGVDAEPKVVGTPTDTDFMFEELPANAEVEVTISAVNTGGESALSEVATFRTPTTETK
ncbi:MAG: fibronectin type III domain-containing protein [Verrucomicrobia bacterium]|nr:fibronectin type III domain-containing protein [Verrucomicrobiota bacterium]